MANGSIYGKGWPFPVRPQPNGRLGLLGGAEKIRQSIWLILATAPGERQMLPEFGCGIHELVFRANTSTLRAAVQRQVQDALARWEPRIDVLEVKVDTQPEQPHVLTISIHYAIRSNNAYDNLVYPFYLVEGPGQV